MYLVHEFVSSGLTDMTSRDAGFASVSLFVNLAPFLSKPSAQGINVFGRAHCMPRPQRVEEVRTRMARRPSDMSDRRKAFSLRNQ